MGENYKINIKMYFSKKYWQIIKYTYRLKKISSFDIKNISYNKSNHIPSIFKDLDYIFIHTGILLKTINFDKIGLKIYYLKKNGE